VGDVRSSNPRLNDKQTREGGKKKTHLRGQTSRLCGEDKPLNYDSIKHQASRQRRRQRPKSGQSRAQRE
jgi:hypothetical protein